MGRRIPSKKNDEYVKRRALYTFLDRRTKAMESLTRKFHRKLDINRIRTLAKYFLLNTFFFNRSDIDMNILYRIWFFKLKPQTLYDISRCVDIEPIPFFNYDISYPDLVLQRFKEIFIIPFYKKCCVVQETLDMDICFKNREGYLYQPLTISTLSSYDVVNVFVKEFAFALI